MKKYLHDTDTKYYNEKYMHQFPDLEIFYIAEYVVVRHCIKN